MPENKYWAKALWCGRYGVRELLGDITWWDDSYCRMAKIYAYRQSFATVRQKIVVLSCRQQN